MNHHGEKSGIWLAYLVLDLWFSTFFIFSHMCWKWKESTTMILRPRPC